MRDRPITIDSFCQVVEFACSETNAEKEYSQGRPGRVLSVFSFDRRFKEEIARSHLTDESAVDMEIIHTEEQLTVNQTVYLRGVLTKKNGSFFLSASNTCKLTLSAKPIEQIKVRVRQFCHVESELLEWTSLLAHRNWIAFRRVYSFYLL